jgi:hypothetical protein
VDLELAMILAAWHPVTHDFGLIHTPLGMVVDGLLNWHTSIDIHYRRSAVTSCLEAALKSLLPLSNSKQRRLFVQTASDWTACFQNGIQGSDPFPAMSFLARTLGVLAMRVCSTPPKAVWPANIWEVYAPPSLGGAEPLGYRRTLAAANDGGRWVFDQSGEPFPFEKLETYRGGRKRDRFTRDLLQEYLAHFGIRPFDDDFFVVDASHPAVLLQQTRPVFNLPEFSLEEVVAGIPWRREGPGKAES